MISVSPNAPAISISALPAATSLPLLHSLTFSPDLPHISMASDESMTLLSSLHDDYYDDTDDGSELPLDLQRLPHNLSRLSMCSSSMYTNDGDRDEDDDQMKLYMSRLSIEGFDADEEFSDDKDAKGLPELSTGDDDSDKEPCCYSLPSTPPRRRRNRSTRLMCSPAKDYASENDAGSEKRKTKTKTKSLKRRVSRDNWAARVAGFSGESESGCGSCGLVVITRPKGGRRSLCMDLDEVKACRDLGFELEHERMVEMPSSGGDSPISNWRISSPGDDPRDVKARLKVWAQAVALASASRNCL